MKEKHYLWLNFRSETLLNAFNQIERKNNERIIRRNSYSFAFCNCISLDYNQNKRLTIIGKTINRYYWKA